MEDTKTSEKWQIEKPDIIILDPDGWDRTNFIYSWFDEEITEEEYIKRRMESTVMGNIDKIKE